MAELKNHLDVLKVLPKTNCRKCGLPTCLTFAVGIIDGSKTLADCPELDPEVLEGSEVNSNQAPRLEEDAEAALAKLQAGVRGLDLAEAAGRLGGRMHNGKLRITVLSKDFTVDASGVVTSDCHVNWWLTLPLLNYVVSCQGLEETGKWVPLRDLPGGADWGRFFEHRCEQPFKRLVDGYTNLFEDIIDIFDATPAPASFDSDIAVVIRPLPRLPILICYWKPEDGMGSSSHMFFDSTAAANLPIDSIYYMCVGLVTMFEKISMTHGK